MDHESFWNSFRARKPAHIEGAKEDEPLDNFGNDMDRFPGPVKDLHVENDGAFSGEHPSEKGRGHKQPSQSLEGMHFQMPDSERKRLSLTDDPSRAYQDNRHITVHEEPATHGERLQEDFEKRHAKDALPPMDVDWKAYGVGHPHGKRGRENPGKHQKGAETIRKPHDS